MDVYDLNLFMVCDKLNTAALSAMPEGYTLRHPREDELDFWKRMHFDDAEAAEQNYDYMTDFFNRVYAPKGDIFFKTCLFAVNGIDEPVGTCFTWKMYGVYTTMHWFKVLKQYENQGIGRALLSVVMSRLTAEDYPVYLHTQTGSFRAVKLYSDFGFKLLTDEVIGLRHNDLEQGLHILKELMPAKDFDKLQCAKAEKEFLEYVARQGTNEF